MRAISVIIQYTFQKQTYLRSNKSKNLQIKLSGNNHAGKSRETFLPPGYYNSPLSIGFNLILSMKSFIPCIQMDFWSTIVLLKDEIQGGNLKTKSPIPIWQGIWDVFRTVITLR